VRTEHGVRHYRDPSCALFRHWALRHTDRIVAVSAFVARTVGTLAPYARIQVVVNGIDLARFQPAPPPADGPFTISAVSRLDPIKRLTLAIEAVARTPTVRLNIVGEGRERGKLERLARERGVESRVRFLGHLPDPRSAIAASDAVINCTREEGLPLAVLEAAAMQRPAIAFDGGGMPEIVQDHRTGWLVKIDTVDAFAATVAEASASRPRAAELGVAARNWVEGRFGIDGMCKSYAAIYREFAGGRANSQRAATATMDE
jgi:glycosyltransferase involved in cell wall biosynthesis